MACNLTFSGVDTLRPRTIIGAGQATKWRGGDLGGGRWAISQAGWYDIAIPKIISDADKNLARTDATICTDTTGSWLVVLNLATAAYLTTPVGGDISASSYLAKAKSIAQYVVDNISTSQSSHYPLRNWLLLLAVAFDNCYPILTSTNKTTWGQNIIARCDTCQATSWELIHGYSGSDQACQLIGALALYGEAGFTSGDYNAATRLNEALCFWFGGDSGITTSGYGRFDALRYYHQNGGFQQSWDYHAQRITYGTKILLAVRNALTGIQVGGESYDPLADEPWLQQLWRSAVMIGCRGDKDHWHFTDTQRSSNPVFSHIEHWLFAASIAFGSDVGKRGAYSSWLWRDSKAQALGQNYGSYYACDMLWFTPSSIPTASPPLWDWTDPQGALSVRTGWNHDAATQVIVHVPQFYFRGHHDLDRGQIQIHHRGKQVLCDTGYYDSSPTDNPSAYGGTHQRGWKNQTISKSGVILVDDGSASPHENTDVNGSFVAWPSGQGGQYWKLNGSDRSPENIPELTGDGGGLAWKCTEGSLPDVAGTILGYDNEVVVLYSNLRRAYLLDYAHYGTDNERVKLFDAKWMVIRNFSTTGRLAVLLLFRVQSRLASQTKRQVWHFWDAGDVETLVAKNLLRIRGAAYYSAEEAPRTHWCAIDYYNPALWNTVRIGGGTSDPSQPGTYDFAYRKSQAPTEWHFYTCQTPIYPSRHFGDVGRVRVEVSPKNAATEHTFACLLIPFYRNPDTGSEDLPDYNWINETDWLGVECNGKAYKLHKTLQQYISSTGPPDVQPPAVPTGLAGTTPASQTVQLTWTPNTESDMYKYKVFKRVKV